MAETRHIIEKEVKRLEDFIECCKNKDVRIAKLSRYAFIGPKDGGDVFSGKVRLTVTAFFEERREADEDGQRVILRWQKTGDARGMLNWHAGTDRGVDSGNGLAEEEALVRKRLELAGIQVVDGEWTKEEVESLLACSL